MSGGLPCIWEDRSTDIPKVLLSVQTGTGILFTVKKSVIVSDLVDKFCLDKQVQLKGSVRIDRLRLQVLQGGQMQLHCSWVDSCVLKVLKGR